jgi:hypothetical protein
MDIYPRGHRKTERRRHEDVITYFNQVAENGGDHRKATREEMVCKCAVHRKSS